MTYAASFALIVALIALDVAEDALSGGDALHLGLETVAMAIAALGGGAAVRSWLGARRDAAEATARAAQLGAEAERWRQEAAQALAGLGAAIDQQFERWALTAAEREVALLLLKGFSTQRIGELRQTSDRTVRQQARAVYAKAGLAGRAELAAFFLEDLLLPQ
ncbi:MAG: LuxR C-terminal-related transcriptional regulator [Myxococcota bacterium]